MDENETTKTIAEMAEALSTVRPAPRVCLRRGARL